THFHGRPRRMAETPGNSANYHSNGHAHRDKGKIIVSWLAGPTSGSNPSGAGKDAPRPSEVRAAPPCGIRRTPFPTHPPASNPGGHEHGPSAHHQTRVKLAQDAIVSPKNSSQGGGAPVVLEFGSLRLPTTKIRD